MSAITFQHRSAVILVGLFALTLPLSARDREGVFEETLTVSAPAEIEVTTGSGNIDVRAGDSSTVRIRGSIQVNRFVSAQDAERIIQELESHPPIEQTGNSIRIGKIKDLEVGGIVSLFLDRHPFSISYELTVPAETRLKSDTGSGDQAVTGLKGPVQAMTGSGNIRLANLNNETRAETGSGDIEVTSAGGTVSVTTGSGNIRASGISGSIRAHTGSGDVTLDRSEQGLVDVEAGSGNVEIRGPGGPLRARTGSGDITASGSPGGDWKLDTGSGNVNLRLSARASFTLGAHTGSGSIESSLPITIQGKVNKSELRGAVRGGGSLVDVGTGSGDVRIE